MTVRMRHRGDGVRYYFAVEIGCLQDGAVVESIITLYSS